MSKVLVLLALTALALSTTAGVHEVQYRSQSSSPDTVWVHGGDLQVFGAPGGLSCWVIVMNTSCAPIEIDVQTSLSYTDRRPEFRGVISPGDAKTIPIRPSLLVLLWIRGTDLANCMAEAVVLMPTDQGPRYLKKGEAYKP